MKLFLFDRETKASFASRSVYEIKLPSASLMFFSVLLVTNLSLSQTFTKITAGPMVNTPGDSRSVNWVDVDNDGFIDCLITNGPANGQNNMLYLNNGSGNFTTLAGDPIVLDNKPSDGATIADSDNDGDLDCFVVNWYNINNMFYTNDGFGGFTELNGGIETTEGGYSETAAWGDYDNDGLLDLYVTNSAGTKRNFLYQNTGANSFTKIFSGPHVSDAFASRSINWTDIDLDGDVDLFVSNESGQDENIYRNNGNSSFTKITTGALLNNGGNTMSSSWGDFDNDGDLDVFLANDNGNNALFRNDGNFNFTKMASDTVSKTPGYSFSSSWSDVDNDGDLDLYVTNAFKTGTKLTNYFYLNNGNSTFTRVGNSSITADSAWSYGCAFGDYDNDGFEDLAVATCRFGNVDAPDFLYHNTGNTNKWLTIKLTGMISNKSAIGAKIKVKATISGNPTWQLREISAQSAYCSENDLRAHFGLGNATLVDSVKVEWPSGIVLYSTTLNTNQFLNIVETTTFTALTDNSSAKDALRFFPNPSSGSIEIHGAKDFNAGDKILITEGSGKLLAKINLPLSCKQFLLDLKKYNMLNGNYFVTLISSEGSITKKLIIDN